MFELLTDYAIQFMQGDGPWFLTLSSRAVHQPTIPLPEFSGTLSDMPADLPDSFDDSLPHPLEARRTPMTADRVEDFTRQYYEGVASLDHVIGELLDQTPEGTLVLFVSHNGFLLGEHGMIDKRVAYEESIRIPLIVHYPPWGAGRRWDVALNLDIGATILDAVSPGSTLGDGLSLRSPTGRREFDYEYFLDPRWPKTPPFVAFRTLTTKVVSYDDGTVHQFYLVGDPEERSPVIHADASAPSSEVAERGLSDGH